MLLVLYVSLSRFGEAVPYPGEPRRRAQTHGWMRCKPFRFVGESVASAARDRRLHAADSREREREREISVTVTVARTATQ